MMDDDDVKRMKLCATIGARCGNVVTVGKKINGSFLITRSDDGMFL